MSALRLNQLRDEIGYALGRGEFPLNELAEFRFLWGTTPSSEKDGLAYTLRDIEEMVANLRREQSIASGASKVRRVNLTYQRPGCDLDQNCCER